MNAIAAKPEPGVSNLSCMEIVGGIEANDQALDLPGLDVWMFSKPHQGAKQGGDVHYISVCGGGRISRLIVADVSGHGTPVAEVSDRLRGLMRKNINRPDQTRLVRALNRDFGTMAQQQRFATAVVATYLAHQQTLTLSNAGHPRPLWYQAARQRWIWLDPDEPGAVEDVSNLPFGIANDSAYRQFAVRMTRDDLVFIYTDGMTEARRPSGKQLGESGVLDVVQQIEAREPSQFLPRLRSRLTSIVGDDLRSDDVTMLLLHANGEQPPRQSLTRKMRATAKMLGLLPS